MIEGEPQFGTIPGTSLSYVSNTGSDIFLDSTNQTYYILLAGRWFSVDLAAEWSVDLRSRREPAAGLRQDSLVQSEGRRSGFGSGHTASEGSRDRQLDSADGDHLALVRRR